MQRLPILETEHLRLVPFTLDLMKATLTDKARLAQLCGARIPEDWPQPDLAEALPAIAQDMEKYPERASWDGIIIHKADNTIIGDMGLMSGPNEEGIADVGYSIIPAYRNHGYATEMLRELLAWAFEEAGIKKITADCLETNTGSIRVLEKAGLHCIGHDKDLLKWEVDREEWPQARR